MMYQILIPLTATYVCVCSSIFAIFVGKNKCFKYNIFYVKLSGVLFTMAHTKMPSKLSYLWFLFLIKHIVFISATFQGEKSLNLLFFYNSPSLQLQYIIILDIFFCCCNLCLIVLTYKHISFY